MENKLITAKTNIYMALGLVCLGLEFFIKRRPAFEDQNFACGMLIGVSIVLLLHGVFFIGKNIGKFRTENKNK